METSMVDPLDFVDREMLAPLVRSALDDPAAEVMSFSCREAKGSFQPNTEVYFFTGQAAGSAGEAPWSLVLKVIRPDAGSDDPQDPLYWKREALALRSGILDHLPGNFAAPRVYAIHEQPGGGSWLWMERVTDSNGDRWPLEYYHEAGRVLGKFNGAYLTGAAPVPQAPWIAQDWLRRYVEQAEPAVRFIRENPRHPLVQKMFGGGLRQVGLAMWAERGRIFDRLDSLPQTFCHQDAFRGNLFAQPGGLVAIDWSFAGMAPVGAELVALVGGTLALSGIPFSDAAALDRLSFEGYLQGLREAGWQGPAKQVRLAYCQILWLRYVFGATIGGVFPLLLDEEKKRRLEEKGGKTGDSLVQGSRDQATYYQSILIEGSRLMGLGYILRLAAGVLREIR